MNTEKRSAARWPTTREAGFRDAEYPIWFGLSPRRGTPGPREFAERLNRAPENANEVMAMMGSIGSSDLSAQPPRRFEPRAFG